jgi:hypothetical protein
MMRNLLIQRSWNNPNKYQRMCLCMLSGSRKVAFKYFRTSVSKRPWNFLRDSRVPTARCIYLRDCFSRGPYIRDEVHPLKPASSPAIFKTGRSEQIAPFLSSISFATSTSLIMINGCPAASTYTISPRVSLSEPH